MSILTSSIVAIVIFSVISAEALSIRRPPQLIYKPDYYIFKDTVNLFYTTHLPTTTTTPPPPPTSPLLLFNYPDGRRIEGCLESMLECPWNVYELAEMIERTSNIGRNIQYDRQSVPVGPVVDPNEIDEEETPETQTTGGQPSENQWEPLTRMQPMQPMHIRRYGIHDKCLPFGEKYAQSKNYKINCKKYRSDSSLKWPYQRWNAMVGCLKCRKQCEKYGEIQYL